MLSANLRTLSSRPRLVLLKGSWMTEAQKTRYIGQTITLATEFHDRDFIWAEHARECEPIIQQRQRTSDRGIRAQPPRKTEPWEHFFSHDSATNKFYKMRRYLLLEFPILQDIGEGRVIEIGAGGGGSLLPVLASNPLASATATDISKTSLVQLKQAAELTLEGSRRIDCVICDSSEPSQENLDRFQDMSADICLIMYTLSAVTPPQLTLSDEEPSSRGCQRGQEAMMTQAFNALRPGGRLLIRDHGLYDLVQMRIPASQFMGGPGHTYIRGDDTQAHFFTCDEIKLLGESVGFKAEEIRYITVFNRNHKTGAELKRVFIHAQFIKPER